MCIFTGLFPRLRRCFKTSPETFVTRGIQFQEKFAASEDKNSDNAQYFLTKAAILFSQARERYHERNDDEALARVLSYLALVDWDLYSWSGKSQGKLSQAITSYDEAIAKFEALPDLPSNYIDLLANAALAYKERFELWHDQSDINKSLEYYTTALRSIPQDSPRYIDISQIIGSIYWKLYCDPSCTETRKIEMMDNANTYFQQAYERFPAENVSEKSNCAYTLARISYAKFQRELRISGPSAKSHLDASIDLYRSAIDCMSGTHPYYSKTLRAIALIIWYRYKEYHEETDLPEAQIFAELALKFYPVGTEECRALAEISGAPNSTANAYDSSSPTRSFGTALTIQSQEPNSPTISVDPYDVHGSGISDEPPSPSSTKSRRRTYYLSTISPSTLAYPSRNKTTRNTLHVLQLSINTRI
ncbi:hypothetical protein BDN70DRAFT_997057 [Pholiota conissans]|uniref:Uncharacterized protein n=1 Tax=Pholiota conissans TaxID=109636 RepID=A0A9P6CVQ5_9AGAR|nr:hypothetical protein BDN70DRAFT_997057 [Pholiota conissans]